MHSVPQTQGPVRRMPGGARQRLEETDAGLGDDATEMGTTADVQNLPSVPLFVRTSCL